MCESTQNDRMSSIWDRSMALLVVSTKEGGKELSPELVANTLSVTFGDSITCGLGH